MRTHMDTASPTRRQVDPNNVEQPVQLFEREVSISYYVYKIASTEITVDKDASTPFQTASNANSMNC